MYKPYAVVKRCHPRRKKKYVSRSVTALVLAKDNRRIQWQQSRTELRLAEEALAPGPIALLLCEIDIVTEDEDTLFSLTHETYEGYTIYCSWQGTCALHGAGQRGCLRIQGKYVSFPDVEQAKRAVRYFQARGWKPHQIMDRGMEEGAYVCLNVHEAVQQRGVFV